jgi:putative polymerase
MRSEALESTFASRPATGDRLVLLPSLIVVGAVCFNAGLAIVNGNITGLTQAPVVMAEVTFVALAHAVALSRYRREMAPWYALLGLFAAFAVIRSLASQTIDVKYLRDVMIIPTFVVLGMTFDARRLGRVFVTVQIVTVVFLILEAVNVDVYSNLFKIQDYYINTRGYTAEDFWNKDSNLYVSAIRPDGSFLSIVDLHRLSSIFLEPVSLGNYCMVVLAFLCACWRELGRPALWFLAVTTAMAMVGCDGRLAMASVLPMVLCCSLAPRMPRHGALIYIPGVVALGFILVSFGHYEPGGDDFPGRIAHTVFLLSNYGLSEYLGLSDEFMSKAVDSGIAYLITTQSIFVVIALWATIAMTGAEDRPDKTRIIHGVMIYVALNMMVSFALLTIKTAALLWFAYGALQGRRTDPLLRSDRRLFPVWVRFQPSKASTGYGEPAEA